MEPVTITEAVASWLGWPIDESQAALLDRYGRWLAEEAAVAGGLGPNEARRIDDRHLADSLLFARGWELGRPPTSLLDLGSGVGLPGIPLAVLWPATAVTLIDRSGRRVGLARRAVRVLGIANVTVVEADAGRHPPVEAELVVARAAGPVEEVRGWARTLAPGARRLVVGGSHLERPREPVSGERLLEVLAEVLDRPVWLRIMAPP